MQIWKWIQKNFLSLLVIVLLLLFFFRKAPQPDGATVTVVRDTIYTVHIDTVYTKPQIIKEIKPVEIPAQYIPDSNYKALRKQFETLVNEYLTKKTYVDTLKVDSLGWVRVEDTLKANAIQDRKFSYNLKEKIITNTITIKEPYKPKSQVFIGGGVGGTTTGTINQVNLGLMLKNKKDRILGVTGGYNFQQLAPQVNLSYFQKIKL